MKDFLLFAGDRYYPSGGWEDFKGSFDSVEEAEKSAKSLENATDSVDWWHIVDLSDGAIVRKWKI